jgi:diadenosine tetraphosphate (Ap4A) HIT family hydrolase
LPPPLLSGSPQPLPATTWATATATEAAEAARAAADQKQAAAFRQLVETGTLPTWPTHHTHAHHSPPIPWKTQSPTFISLSQIKLWF